MSHRPMRMRRARALSLRPCPRGVGVVPDGASKRPSSGRSGRGGGARLTADGLDGSSVLLNMILRVCRKGTIFTSVGLASGSRSAESAAVGGRGGERASCASCANMSKELIAWCAAVRVFDGSADGGERKGLACSVAGALPLRSTVGVNGGVVGWLDSRETSACSPRNGLRGRTGWWIVGRDEDTARRGGSSSPWSRSACVPCRSMVSQSSPPASVSCV